MARFPYLQVSPTDEPGVSTVTIEDIDVNNQPTSKADFGGVSSVTLEFTDWRLSYIRIGYPKSRQWNSMDEFLAKVAERLDLSGQWKHFYDLDEKIFRGMEDFRDKYLECDGFRIGVGIGVEALGEYMPHIQLEDMVAAQTVKLREDEKRRREAEVERQNSKP